LLNGGCDAIAQAGIRDRDTIYTDTSGAASRESEGYVNEYGSERIMFGSDSPFFIPEVECEKIRKLNLPDRTRREILGQSLRRLLGEDWRLRRSRCQTRWATSGSSI
jgi:predicted TIM-barrel fold metal-dependent hydrolase